MPSEMARAGADIPWSMRDTWPKQAAEAAELLRERFVPEHKREEPYLQTGVQFTADPAVREAFITFAAHAYEAAFWRHDHTEVASLSDEGTFSPSTSPRASARRSPRFAVVADSG